MVFINQLNGDMKMMGDDHNMVVPLKMGNHPCSVWKSQRQSAAFDAPKFLQC